MRLSDWSSDLCSSDLAGRPYGRVEHLRRAVRQSRRCVAGLPQGLDDSRHFRIGVEFEIQAHQLFAQAGSADAGRLHRIVEGVAGDLPEIDMRVPAAATPRIQLGSAPSRAKEWNDV